MKIHEFSDTRFVSTLSQPENRLEYAATLWRLILERARDDLLSENVRIRMDAYFWLVNKGSDLYTVLAPRFGLQIEPADFHDDILRAGLPIQMTSSVAVIRMDTDDPADWCYSPVHESSAAYGLRLCTILVKGHTGDELFAAEINNCRFAYSGRKAEILKRAVMTLVEHRMANRHGKTTMRAIQLAAMHGDHSRSEAPM